MHVRVALRVPPARASCLQVVRHLAQWETLVESPLMANYERKDLDVDGMTNPPPRQILERMFHCADYRRPPPPTP